MVNRLDPDYEYNSMNRNLESDWRLEKTKTIDVVTANQEYEDFKSGEIYKWTNAGISLLDKTIGVPVENVRDTLQSKYNLNQDLTNEVLKTMANNCDKVEAHKNPYNNKIMLRKK